MGFEITVYRIDTSLPYDFWAADYNLENPDGITPGIYKKYKDFHVDCKTLEELKEKLEKMEWLMQSDVVEWNFDSEALKNPSKELAEMMETELNYFVMKFWGLDSIAIEKEKVFIELTLKEMAELFVRD